MTKQHFQYFIWCVEHDITIMFQCDNSILLKIAQLIKKNFICLAYYIFLEFNFSSYDLDLCCGDWKSIV